MMIETSIPRFATGVRFEFNQARNAWVVLAPERLFVPDEMAVEVLKLIDGQRSLTAVIDQLTAMFNAPREQIANDVVDLLQGLSDKGVIRL